MKGLKVLKTICFLYFSGVLACPTIDDKESTNEANVKEEDKETCNEIFANNGMNYTSFHEGAAHGIHSLSLEEIRYFFKADAPEQNRIPSVNIDFRSENIIHFDAPLWGYEKRFDTWALKIMDWFMLNDQPYLFQNKANTLEKIAHQYHMHEIYEKAAVIYNDLVENPPNNVNGICACANDLTENGVMTEVVNIARQLKHFGVKSFGYDYGRVPSSAARGVQAKLYGRSPSSAARGDFGGFSYDYGRVPSSAERRVQANTYGRVPSSAARGDFGGLSYKYGRVPSSAERRVQANTYGRVPSPAERGVKANVYGRGPFGKRSADIHDEKENTKALINNYLAHSTKETGKEIVYSPAGWKAGTLVGPKFDNWVPYAAMLTYSLPDEKGIRDFAYFIYCMLNHQ